MWKKAFIWLIAISLAVVGETLALAQPSPSRPLAKVIIPGPPGKLKPEGKLNPGTQHEVIFFFWYGCQECRQTHKIVDKLKPLLPPNTELLVEPILNKKLPNVLASQGVFYLALERLGIEATLREEIFETILAYTAHKSYMEIDKIPLRSLLQQLEFIAKRGYSREKFMEAIRSINVLQHAELINTFTATKGIFSVPIVVVDGKYYYTYAQNMDDFPKHIANFVKSLGPMDSSPPLSPFSPRPQPPRPSPKEPRRPNTGTIVSYEY
jgi:hypothetical protein